MKLFSDIFFITSVIPRNGPDIQVGVLDRRPSHDRGNYCHYIWVSLDHCQTLILPQSKTPVMKTAGAAR